MLNFELLVISFWLPWIPKDSILRSSHSQTHMGLNYSKIWKKSNKKMFILWEHQCNRWGRKVWRESIELVSSLTHIIVPSTMMIFQQQILSFFFALSCGFKFSEEIKHEKQQWALSLVLHSYSTSTNSNIDNSNQLQKLPLSEMCELSLSCVFFFFFQIYYIEVLLTVGSHNSKGKKMKAGFVSTLFFLFFFLMVWYFLWY